MKEKISYAEQLKDFRWKAVRKIILARDLHTCRNCLATDRELQVHHFYYLNGKKAWEYPEKDLVTLCAPCHKLIEGMIDEIKIRMAEGGLELIHFMYEYNFLKLFTEKYFILD